MLKGNRKGIDQVHIDKGGQQSGEYKSRWAFTLDFHQEKVSEAYHQTLQKANRDIQEPPAKVGSCGCEVFNVFILVHFQFKDGDENNTTDPDGQVAVKRREGRTIIGNRINLFRFDLHR